ncbi:MAG: hypothetical protein KME32_32395 [Mojavia pulchra JT2-VF2]|jgi:hypothetical protein|uniref:Uncharacterized protein n=1 Tax=Mojavia pulchra JT2-VF2 TaxID=287848 RepID=A0A951Q711_9NOST|nr:hypothetical protein [Mojavia pulchra JT2-VF2]
MDIKNNETNSNANLNLAYEYTKIVLEAKVKILDTLDSRMGMFLGFGGVLLKFGLDAPSELPSEQTLKTTFIALTVLSVCTNASGLLAKGTGNAVKPKKLMTDKYYNEENPRVKAFLINTWAELVEELEEMGKTKSIYLNSAITLLALAVIMLGTISIIEIYF